MWAWGQRRPHWRNQPTEIRADESPLQQTFGTDLLSNQERFSANSRQSRSLYRLPDTHPYLPTLEVHGTQQLHSPSHKPAPQGEWCHHLPRLQARPQRLLFALCSNSIYCSSPAGCLCLKSTVAIPTFISFLGWCSRPYLDSVFLLLPPNLPFSSILSGEDSKVTEHCTEGCLNYGVR